MKKQQKIRLLIESNKTELKIQLYRSKINLQCLNQLKLRSQNPKKKNKTSKLVRNHFDTDL